jgi:hypothetical protein
MASVGLVAGPGATTASAPADSSRPGAASRPGQDRFSDLPYRLATACPLRCNTHRSQPSDWVPDPPEHSEGAELPDPVHGTPYV